MRLSIYGVIAILTILVTTVWIAQLEIENTASVGQSISWGLLKSSFELCLLLPLELFAFYLVARAIDHPIAGQLGRLFKYLGLPLLGIAALVVLG